MDKRMINLLTVFLILLNTSLIAQSKSKKSKASRFRVLAIYENGGHHVAYSKAAKQWLDHLAVDSSFTIDYVQDTKSIDESFLKKYQLFIQLDYPPYGWTDKAAKAFTKYIEQGKGGWIGLHHATLLGEFDGYPMWPWFSGFMGTIRFENYISSFADALVQVEDKDHPCMKGISTAFIVRREEWYTYNQSPRGNVHVIASVDESSYLPASEIKMGDHPVIWSNENMKARNLYIFMGHAPELFDSEAYTTLFRNAIFWAADK